MLHRENINNDKNGNNGNVNRIITIKFRAKYL